MQTHDMPSAGGEGGINQRWLRLGFGVFAAIALFFLWQEHRAHLLGALPWLLLLACPLMHRLMHRGHHHHHSRGGDGDAKEKGAQGEGAKPAGHEHSGHGCC